MSTYKRTGLDGVDYAMPSKRPVPPCPPPPKPPVPPCPPVHLCPPEDDWGVYPFYPPYPDMDAEPVPTPPIPGRPGPGPVPPCPTLQHPYPPMPPYPPPKPEKVDECSKKLAKLSQKAKVLVQMIKDFEQKNKPAILTIGANSYQFGTNLVTDFDGEPASGMYSAVICGDSIEELLSDEYVIDDTKTRVALKDPKDILQSELARVRLEITLVAAALNNEVSEDGVPTPGTNKNILGTDED